MSPIGGPSQADEHSRTRDTQLPGTRIAPCKLLRDIGRATLVFFIAMLVCFVFCALPISPISASAGFRPQLRATVLSPNPDAICMNCHREIYEKYERTPMARGSGAAVNGLLQGGFLHAASGIRYDVFLRDGKV